MFMKGNKVPGEQFSIGLTYTRLDSELLTLHKLADKLHSLAT